MKVFNNPYNQSAKVWSAQGASIMYNGGKDDIAQVLGAVNDVRVTFGRRVNTQYPIGGLAPIKLVGIPSGTLTLQTLIGPTSIISDFLKKISDACTEFTITIKSVSKQSSNKNCPEAKPQTLTLTGCVGTTVNYTLTAGGDGMTVANGAFTIEFTDLDWANA